MQGELSPSYTHSTREAGVEAAAERVLPSSTSSVDHCWIKYTDVVQTENVNASKTKPQGTG